MFTQVVCLLYQIKRKRKKGGKRKKKKQKKRVYFYFYYYFIFLYCYLSILFIAKEKGTCIFIAWYRASEMSPHPAAERHQPENTRGFGRISFYFMYLFLYPCITFNLYVGVSRPIYRYGEKTMIHPAWINLPQFE